MPTVAFATLGCRLNQVDTQEMAGLLEASGFETVPFETDADVVVVNSCTVTGRADFSDRQMIRRAARENPRARVVVTGCWAQTSPEAVAAMGEVDLVVGNADKQRLPDLLARLLAGPDPGGAARVHVSDVGRALLPPAAPPVRRGARSRAFLKVQEGCQHRCAFCIVPLARGRSRSRAPEVVRDHVRALVAAGHAEVVLTGVDLGHYGADLVPRTTLAALLRALADVPGLRWLRLSSLLPAYVTDELIEVLVGSPCLAPHLHVPLQSGSDRVLRAMRRPYTFARYRALIERLAAAIPRLGLGTDLIVGFPGESDEDFARTSAAVEALPFSYLHVFGYSDRKGTEAAALPGRVGAPVIARRSRALRALGARKSLAFRRQLVGRVEDVLVLGTRDRVSGRLVGLTGNYVEVLVDGPDALMRGVARVRITAAGPDATAGVVLDRDGAGAAPGEDANCRPWEAV